jgi:uncharacterized membrane protein YqjE
MSATHPRDTAARGLLDSLRAVGETLVELVHVRGQLLGVELREEIERRRQALVLAAIAFAFLHVALLMLTLLVTVVFWDTHRVAAIAITTALYLALGVGTLVRLRTAIAAWPAPFAATLGELGRDFAGLRPPP